MGQSNEIPRIDELPTVDYSELPPEIEAVVGQQPYTVEEKVKLTWDGNQFLVRIPTEIANEMRLSPESRMRFELTKPLPNSESEPTVDIALIP